MKLTQYTAVPPVLSIVVVADEVKPRFDQATPIQFFWLSGPEIQRENIIVDQYSLGLVSQLENNAPVHSMELLETIESNGLRRIHGVLEKQMLEEAGYGRYGNNNNNCYYFEKEAPGLFIKHQTPYWLFINKQLYH